MINVNALKEEAGQILYLKNEWNGETIPVEFLWFHQGNIEVKPVNNIVVVSIPKKSWHKLSHKI